MLGGMAAETMMREEDGDIMYGVEQMLPVFGKRSLQREGAERAAEGERWSFEERKLELRRMVKETWYQLYFVDRSMEIVEKNIGILDDLTRFTETM